LTLYDLPDDGPGPLGPGEARLKYPDYVDSGTFTVVGPVGAGTCKGEAFAEYAAAHAHFTALYGKPLEAHWWPLEEGSGGKYGFKFRKVVQ
jgi:hypothetical protein